jgi:transcriptional regulator with XRE-family HTH domain
VSAIDKHEELILLGAKIRAIRESKGISRVQLAFEINTTEKQILRIEFGQINTGVYSLILIANVFEISPKEFFQ